MKIVVDLGHFRPISGAQEVIKQFLKFFELARMAWCLASEPLYAVAEAGALVYLAAILVVFGPIFHLEYFHIVIEPDHPLSLSRLPTGRPTTTGPSTTTFIGFAGLSFPLLHQTSSMSASTVNAHLQIIWPIFTTVLEDTLDLRL